MNVSPTAPRAKYAPDVSPLSVVCANSCAPPCAITTTTKTASSATKNVRAPSAWRNARPRGSSSVNSVSCRPQRGRRLHLQPPARISSFLRRRWVHDAAHLQHAAGVLVDVDVGRADVAVRVEVDRPADALVVD